MASSTQFPTSTYSPPIIEENASPFSTHKNEIVIEETSMSYLKEELALADTLRRSYEETSSRSLSEVLHQGIHTVHIEAKQNGFLKDLITGGMTFCSHAYVHYLCNLFVIHEALETLQNTCLTKCPFVFPLLFRSERILEDIRLWSIFNDSYVAFADLESSSFQFKKLIFLAVTKSTNDFVSHIQKLGKENPFHAVGILYALYGTILSGGQLVKKGVKKGFVERISQAEENDEEKSLLKNSILQAIKNHPSNQEFYAEKSVSLFQFDQENFSPQSFKETRWHQGLNDVRALVDLNHEKKHLFEASLVEEASGAIRAILTMIEQVKLGVKEFKWLQPLDE